MTTKSLKGFRVVKGRDGKTTLEKADEAFGQIALKKAYAHYAATCAERDAMNN